MQATLLVELLTEELPPKSLAALALSFSTSIRDELVAAKLVEAAASYHTDLATPRRLAALISSVSDSAPAEEREVAGPAANAAPAAVSGFARKHGVALESLQRKPTPKGEVFVARINAGGASLDAVLGAIVDKAIKKLPIAKVMRWGSGDAQFVRPVHGLVM